ncbi:hypothetical protein K9N68_34350 (plasmid) [Kovacikia minuta CCNUW1]|uniref:hypothetical protein n=1 Tax=Kovacikia minuta TaxID=2931930 RepID=UPI001CCAB38B|nr:hypothetical protein [Kovacikia minuta]UBF30298.1 hypothetical protein K9N68_34350 [Kovacikia minuta CCNUW1]
MAEKVTVFFISVKYGVIGIKAADGRGQKETAISPFCLLALPVLCLMQRKLAVTEMVLPF